MGLRLLLVGIFAVLLATFAAQNAEPVPIRFLQWEAQVALVLVIVASAAVGGLLAGVLVGFRHLSAERQLRRERDQLQARVTQLEQELRRTAPSAAFPGSSATPGIPPGPGAPA